LDPELFTLLQEVKGAIERGELDEEQGPPQQEPEENPRDEEEKSHE
jgi:hypothetical protein